MTHSYGTVVVLTALPLEYAAVCAHLADTTELVHPSGTRFTSGVLPGSRWRVALAEIGEGNGSAAVVTERANAWLAPEALLFVGVAGALKKDIAIGDVVVATRVYGYHGGKHTPDGFLARPRAWDASNRLEQAARAALRDPEWTRRLPEADRSAAPAVHFKPVAAGEVLLNDRHSSLAAQLTTFYNDAVAIEMESAGMAQAAHLAGGLHALTVRGISDKADGRKHAADRSGSQVRAAARAASAAMAVLDRLTPLRPGPAPAPMPPGPDPSVENELRRGTAELNAHAYRAAGRVFARVVAAADSSDASYYLALADLQGRSPRGQVSERLAAVTREALRAVRLAPSSPHAAALLAIVEEDTYLPRGGRDDPPPLAGLRVLAARCDPVHAAELVEHCPAPQSLTWNALARRTESMP